MLDTLAVAVLLTLPAYNQALRWVPPSERDNPADSMQAVCEQGTPLQDLDSLIVYGSPATGGGWRRVYGKRVRGLEGRADSTVFALPGWVGGHFYWVCTDTAGNEACVSPTLYFGTITGVPAPPKTDTELEEWFDILGRKIRRPSGTGVFFLRRHGKVKKVVVVYGRPVRPP